MVTYDPKDPSTYTLDPNLSTNPPVVVWTDPKTSEKRYAVAPHAASAGLLHNPKFSVDRNGALKVTASLFIGKESLKELNFGAATVKLTEVQTAPSDTPLPPGSEVELLLEVSIAKQVAKAASKSEDDEPADKPKKA
jgi:hypothetical protein